MTFPMASYRAVSPGCRDVPAALVPLVALAQRRRRLAWLAAGLWAVSGGLALVGLLMLTDAMVDLPGLVRGVAMVLVPAGAATWLRWIRLRWPQGAQSLYREAAAGEQAMGVPDNAMVNAAWLGLESSAHSPLTQALVARAMTRGSVAAQRLAPRTLVPWRPVQRALAVLLAVLILGGVVGVIQPGVWRAELPRVLMPWSDLPAFSRTTFTLDVVPASPGAGPGAGEDVQLVVTLGGRLPSEASLYLRDEAGTTRRVALRLESRGQTLHAQHRLGTLRQPVTVWVQADTGRSARITLTPSPREHDPAAHSPEGSPPPDPGNPSPDTTTQPQSSVARDAFPQQVRGGMFQAGRLQLTAAQLAALSAELARLTAEHPGQPLPADLAAILRQLAGQIDRQTAEGNRLADLLRALAERCAAGRGDPALCRALAQAANLADAHQLPGLASQAPAMLQGQGGTGAQGAGQGNATTASPLSTWLMQLAQAAADDAANLDRIQQLLREALGQSAAGGTDTAGAGASGTPSTGDPTTWPTPAMGTGIDTATGGDRLSTDPAILDALPATYRVRVQQYFERLRAEAAARHSEQHPPGETP